MEVQSITVVGAGQMGSGIAQVCAQAGYDVLLSDASDAALTKGVQGIEARFKKLVGQNRLSEADCARAIDRITATNQIEELARVDLVIESASENEAIKASIFKSLTPHLAAHTLLASNTSSISITRLGANTDRPERFMGLHFMNPVPVMQLVELIRGIATGQEAFEECKKLVARLGKSHTVSADFPAFIVNRVLIPMINEAAYVLFEGVGNVESIDSSMRLGANHPMGPLQLADFIGLDTCVEIMKELNEGLADTKYRPCPLMVKYVEAGWTGRKSGRGFYDYRGETPVPTR